MSRRKNKGMHTIEIAYAIAKGVLIDARTHPTSAAYSAVAKIAVNELAIRRTCHESSRFNAPTHIDYVARVNAYMMYQDEAFTHLAMIGYLERENEHENYVRAREYHRLKERLDNA